MPQISAIRVEDKKPTGEAAGAAPDRFKAYDVPMMATPMHDFSKERECFAMELAWCEEHVRFIHGDQAQLRRQWMWPA